MYSNKTKELRGIIEKKLLPMLKGKKCILLDVPYYTNIGDTLIWQGTKHFLADNKITCLFSASKETFKFPHLSEDVVILLQGGGNFGDIWIQHQQFRSRVIAYYPNNKIIILPQTVFFSEKANMLSDAEKLGKHENLTIVGRDRVSYDILIKYYHKNNILLLPDMAFCIDPDTLSRQGVKPVKTALFFKRTDKEANNLSNFSAVIPSTAEEHEWPTMEPHILNWKELWEGRIQNRFPMIYDWYWDKVMRPYYINLGVRFIGSYKLIYTTRLHGAILSVLLGKSLTFFDNSYGKNSSFYDTWLKDEKNIKFIR